MVHGKLYEPAGIPGAGFLDHLLPVGVDGMETDKQLIGDIFAVVTGCHEGDNFQLPFTEGDGALQLGIVRAEDVTGFVDRREHRGLDIGAFIPMGDVGTNAEGMGHIPPVI